MTLRAELDKKIAQCQGKDRHRLRRRLARGGDDRDRARIEQAIEDSVARRIQRETSKPLLSFPEELPISARRDEIAIALERHQIIIVCGETGSGKTTQLPKICLSIGRGVDGLIGHTQPRRLAARTVATRIAEEMQSPLGAQVGFQTRFQRRLSDQNRIKIMTDGILLAEIQRDRWLNQYDTIIIDEAHERSLNIDFLLGYLKQLTRKRPELKLIITSATLDVARIAAHFENAPVVSVTGRTYPVEVRYRPVTSANDDAQDNDVNRAIADTIVELQEVGRGDVLVFLPGERDIREVSKSLRFLRERFEVCALYARLSPAEQQRIFVRGSKTRIILSTNVAETSLTVPGIRYVVDVGTARVSRYSWRSQIQRLPIEKISRASAAQRAGRCGRIGPGVCVRLYAEEDFNEREEFTQPEIQRTNLAAVVLQMASLRLGDIASFPFIDPPEMRLVRDGYRLLTELQAVTRDRQLTAIGKQLAVMPIDPRLGRMLVAASTFGALREVLIIVTGLAVQDPRERPYDKRQAADECHQKFHDVRSDFVSFLNLWDYVDVQSEALSSSALRRLCAREFINHRRWREWRDLHRKLKPILRELSLVENSTAADYDAIHRSLLSGLLDHVGRKDEKNSFVGSRNRKFYPIPGSALSKKLPKWMMAAEIVETSKVFARTNAAVSPQWIERQASHLLTRQHSQAHWQKKSARVGGYEKLSLNGLVINPRRRIDYSTVDKRVARELFIRHALVYNEWDSRCRILHDNHAVISSIEDLEARVRRRDILVHEDALFGFYDARIPPEVNSGASFSRWFKQVKEPGMLRINESDILQSPVPVTAHDEFPTTWKDNELELPLTYCFEPGTPADGVTLTVPIALIARISPLRIEWIVPGLLEQKIVALLRSLPKALRKNFIPVPDFARAVLDAIEPYQGSLCTAIADALTRMTGINIPPAAWGTEIEPHLCMRIAVQGEAGKVIATSRNIEQLRESVATDLAAKQPTPTQRAYERGSITAWECGPLPLTLRCEEDGYTIERYPALVEEGENVALRLFDSDTEAKAAMNVGIRRLIFRELKREIRYLNKNLPEMQRLCLLISPIVNAETFKQDMYLAAIQRCFLQDADLPRDEQAFTALLTNNRARYIDSANALGAIVLEILTPWSNIRHRLDKELPLSWVEAAQDVRAQLSSLVYPGFQVATPFKWLERMPRYMRAIDMRLDKLTATPDRDRARRSELAPLFVRVQQQDLAQLTHPERFIEYKWLLEELRVSLFAQELGALEKVSIKRLDRLWQEIV